MKLALHLKRSHFIAGLIKTLRGLVRDLHVLFWLANRAKEIANYLNTHQLRKLQLGASNNILNGWLNTDIHVNHDLMIYLDATKRFPFDDNTFDYIMAEHMIEHLDCHGVQIMLRECFRVLKPGGHVRFATPDLKVLLALHCPEKTAAQTNYIEWAGTQFLPGIKECRDVFVINNFFRAWGHQFLYDAKTLNYALGAAAFREIKFYKPGISEDRNLENLESHGRELESEEINQFETIVVEGRK
jgi:predicted SAM-dependent methyltransferase